jgi:hypothetical protein
MKLLGIINAGFDVTDQLPIRFSAFVWGCNETVHQLFIDFKKAYDPERREPLYNILVEFGVPMSLFRLIKLCLNKAYSKVREDKHFPTLSSTKLV